MATQLTALQRLLAALNDCGEMPSLSEANLRGANLRGANLSEADLRGANLSGANLSEADLTITSFCLATIDGARVHDKDIGGPGWILYALTDVEAEMVEKHRKSIEVAKCE